MEIHILSLILIILLNKIDLCCINKGVKRCRLWGFVIGRIWLHYKKNTQYIKIKNIWQENSFG